MSKLMKRTITLIALLLIVISGVLANDGKAIKSRSDKLIDGKDQTDFKIGNFEAAIINLQNNRYRLLVDSRKDDPIFLRIYDTRGELVFKDKQEGGFTRIYDLSAMGSAYYFFELKIKGNTYKISTKQ